MFQNGDAKPAIEFYSSVFNGFKVVHIEEYGANETGHQGSIKVAKAEFCNLSLMIIDSPIPHAFDFTPSMSLFVDFENHDELDLAYARLSEMGEVLMPINNHGFSQMFAWVKDKFGVSWQLNLPERQDDN